MKTYRKDIPLKFGKYKGVELDVIEERDPKYLIWLIKNVKMFKNYYTLDEIQKIEKTIEREKITIF